MKTMKKRNMNLASPCLYNLQKTVLQLEKSLEEEKLKKRMIIVS